MKRKYLLIIVIILLLTSCKGRTYVVRFVDEDIEIASIEVKKGDNILGIDKPTKEGYLFLNWLKDGIDYDASNPINSDLTLEASWVAIPDPVKTFVVTFNFGDVVKTVSVHEGDKVAIPKEKPVKDKHKFIGWYLDENEYNFDEAVTKDITLVAKFEKNRIIIDYDLDGGTGVIQVEIEKGTIPNRPKNPKKFGYKFINWTIDGKVYNFDTKIYEDTLIKANYEANVYVKVTFDTDGGEEVASQMIVSGETIANLPTPKKEGHVFKYWTFQGDKFDSSMKIITDITLVAYYEEE